MSRAAVASGAALIAVTVAIVAITGGGDGRTYRVRAQLADAEGIQKNFVVRVDGVDAGKVEKVDVDRHDVAWVDVALDRSVAPIGVGARLSARAANLLGEKYLDLSPGDRRRPVASGTTIPLSRTNSEVQLDDVFNTLTPTTRAQLRILVNEAGIGFAGRGTDLNQLLGQLPGTLRESTQLLEQIRRQNAELGRLIIQGRRFLEPQDARRRDVADFVTSTQRLLTTTAARRRELGKTVAQAPRTLAQLRVSLSKLTTSARHLQPASKALRQSAPQLDRVLGRLPAFAASAHGTLRTAEEAAPALQRLGRDGTPRVRRLTTTLQQLSSFAEASRPVVESVGRGGVFAGLLNVMQNWTRAINQQDRIGHYFRLRLVVSPEALDSLLSQFAPPPGKSRRRPGVKPLVDKVKDLTKPKAPAPAPAPSPAPSASPIAPVQHVLDSAKGLLDYLLK